MEDKTVSTCYEITLRPFLRYLGVLVPIVIGLPHIIALIGLSYFAIVPSSSDVTWLKNVSWEGMSFSVFFAVLGVWTGWRWWRVGAFLDKEEVLMRGLFYSTRIPSESIYGVRLASIMSHSFAHGPLRKHRYEFIDANGGLIAVLPSSISFCKEFDVFLAKLEQLANRNKRSAT